MNWKKLLLNLGGAVAAGFATAVSNSSAPTKGSIITAIIMAVAANLAGLFQHPPSTPTTDQSTAAILEKR